MIPVNKDRMEDLIIHYLNEKVESRGGFLRYRFYKSTDEITQRPNTKDVNIVLGNIAVGDLVKAWEWICRQLAEQAWNRLHHDVLLFSQIEEGFLEIKGIEGVEHDPETQMLKVHMPIRVSIG